VVSLKDILIESGFSKVEAVYTFASSKLTITATYLAVVPSFNFGEAFAVYTTHSDGRTLQFEPAYIPTEADSFEQALAFLVFGIGLKKESAFDEVPDWYMKGKSYQGHLPWEQEKTRAKAEYDLLPKVRLEMAWMKILMQMLRNKRDKLTTTRDISFHFDGKLLNVRGAGTDIPIPGIGAAWSSVYYLNSDFLNHVPKAHKNYLVIIVKDGKLQLSNPWIEISRADPAYVN
jgi:hypothetical protein